MSDEIVVHKRRGRPPKNPQAQPNQEVTQVAPVEKIKNQANVDPNWVPTETVNGTKVWIKSIIKITGCGHEFMVVVHPDRPFETTVKSTGLLRPNFNTPELEKEFEGIQFYERPALTTEVVAKEVVTC
jgi:hypothetical protein